MFPKNSFQVLLLTEQRERRAGFYAPVKKNPRGKTRVFSLRESVVFSFAADAEKQLLSGVFPPSDQ